MPRLDLDGILNGRPPDPDWLVPGFLSRGNMVVLAGDAGVGKSALAYNLAVGLSSGTTFLGEPVPESRVLYFDEENSEIDLGCYVSWAWIGLGRPDRDRLKANLTIEHFSLTGERNFYDYMIAAASTIKPDLIVIDTATSALQLLDENSNAEASAAIRRLRAMRKRADERCTLLVLKHAKHNHKAGEQRTIRGAKTWIGESDACYFHTAPVGRPQATGLRNTIIEPHKVRAYGLRQRIEVIPERRGDGLVLSKRVLPN